MNITRKQLNELLRLITYGVLKEYGSLGSSLAGNDDSGDNGTADDGAKPDDAKTAYEKSKAERDAEKKRQDMVRTAKLDLDATKKQQNYFNSQVKKNKTDILAKQKKVQQMSGASNAAVVPAGGTIAENVR